MKIIHTIALAMLLLLGSCSPANDSASHETSPSTIRTSDKTEVKTIPPFTQEIEKAHQKKAFRNFAAVQFNLVLSFGGRERFNGTISLTTDSGKGVLETNDGQQIYFSNSKVYVDPEAESGSGIRFTAYTWPYFFMLPYKISDPGTIMNDYPQNSLNGHNYLTGKLSFESGVGDAPDDWYVLYADEQSSLLQVAAYIVTAGKSRIEAEKDPHAIEYLNYVEVEGIPIATQWKFWGWRNTEGLTDQLGEASLSNITFLKDAGKLFDPPANFVEGE